MNGYNDSVKKEILTLRGHIPMTGYSHGLKR